MRNKSIIFAGILIALVVLSACSFGAKEPTPIQPTVIIQPPAASTQSATGQNTSPVATPSPQVSQSIASSPLSTPKETPESQPGTGTVVGVLLLKAGNESTPVANQILYLAEVIKNEQGEDSFAAMDRTNSPKAITDNQGHFLFVNVPPGNYGLVLDTISNSYLLLQPGSEEAVLVSATADSTIDLGTLEYDSLPIPSP